MRRFLILFSICASIWLGLGLEGCAPRAIHGLTKGADCPPSAAWQSYFDQLDTTQQFNFTIIRKETEIDALLFLRRSPLGYRVIVLSHFGLKLLDVDLGPKEATWYMAGPPFTSTLKRKWLAQQLRFMFFTTNTPATDCLCYFKKRSSVVLALNQQNAGYKKQVYYWRDGRLIGKESKNGKVQVGFTDFEGNSPTSTILFLFNYQTAFILKQKDDPN